MTISKSIHQPPNSIKHPKPGGCIETSRRWDCQPKWAKPTRDLDKWNVGGANDHHPGFQFYLHILSSSLAKTNMFLDVSPINDFQTFQPPLLDFPASHVYPQDVPVVLAIDH